MTLLVIGATAAHEELLRRAASQRRRIRIAVGEGGASRPDWVLVATPAQRAAAMHRHKLPAYRVIEVPALGDSTSLPADAVRDALARMFEIGAHRPQVSRWGVALAARLLPAFMRRIASYIRIEDQERAQNDERGAARAVRRATELAVGTPAPASTKRKDVAGRILIVIRRQDVSLVRTLLGQFLRQGDRVHIALQGEEDRVAPLLKDTPGVTVGAAPPPGQGFAAWLVAQEPGVLILTPPREERAQAGCTRAARASGVRSVMLALRWDDYTCPIGVDEVPDCAVAWNTEQRRRAVASGIPGARTSVIGVSLPLDTPVPSEPPPRESYCASLGLDPARKIVLFAPAGDETSAAQMDLFGAWLSALRASTDPTLRDASVVVRLRSDRTKKDWAAVAVPGALVIHRPPIDAVKARRKLLHALVHADAVVALDMHLLFEAAVRGRPVLALLREDLGPDAQELSRFVETMGRAYDWPLAARELAEHLDQLSRVLEDPEQSRPAAGRSVVRPHGPDMDPGEVIAGRLLGEILARPLRT